MVGVLSISFAQIISGNLFISLTDGTKLNLGNVVGPTGAKGATGATGVAGLKGPTGATGAPVAPVGPLSPATPVAPVAPLAPVGPTTLPRFSLVPSVNDIKRLPLIIWAKLMESTPTTLAVV